MRIAAKLKLSAWAPVLMAVIIGLALLISHKTMERSLEEGKTTRQIMHSMNELNSFARSYMLYPNDRPRLQFLMEHDSVTELIADIRGDSTEKRQILERIHHNSKSMKEAFLKLVSNYQNPAPAANAELIKEAKERLAGRVLIKSREVVSGALRLESLIHDEIATTQRRINLLIFFLIIIIALPLTTALIRMMRKINASLTALRTGTEVIAKGNLDHRIAIAARDEIGELSRSFNLMTEQLRDTTVSRNELSKEAEERMRAEELLRTTLESLGDGFFACDGDWRFVYVNGPAERVLGIRREEVLCKSHWEVFPLTLGTRLEQEYRRAAAGEIRDFENFYEPWGRWFHNRCFPREGGGISVYFEDITERKATEQRIEQGNREIALVNRILRVFTEATGDELFDQVLDIVQEGLASRHGVFGYISEPGHLTCPSLSKMLDECEVGNKCIHYPPEKWKGLWARALREKHSFYTNEPSKVPAGHPAIHNNLAAPILFRGEAIGLLNVANKEDEYTEVDRTLLEAMAGRIAPLLYAWIQKKLREDERAEAEEELRRKERHLRLALDAAYLIAFEWDIQANEVRRFVSADPELAATSAQTPGTLEAVREVVHPDDRERFTANVFAAMDQEGGRYESEFRIVHSDGKIRWLYERGYVDRDAQGRPGRLIGLSQDITERKQVEDALRVSLAEKEVLLKEIHHRVKNNMQVVSSLVALQADDTKNAVIRDVLQDVAHRVRSMAMVHEKLYQSTDLARVEFADYAQSLLNYLWRAHGSDADGVQLALDLEPVLLPVNMAVPCGLILNELFINALKHAFNGRGGGRVNVSLRGDAQGRVRLCVRDNGTGLPEQFDWRQSRSLGLRLVQMLAKQLRADVEVSRVEGTEFTITFGESRI